MRFITDYLARRRRDKLALKYAQRLCSTLAEKHFPENKDFRVQDSIYGVIAQIDNITTALERRPKP